MNFKKTVGLLSAFSPWAIFAVGWYDFKHSGKGAGTGAGEFASAFVFLGLVALSLIILLLHVWMLWREKEKRFWKMTIFIMLASFLLITLL